MPSSIISPFPVFNDLDGSPLENGYIYIGQSNLNPETAPVNVFWDAARTIPAAQPIRTIGGFPSRNGSPSNVYVEADTYSITVRNSRRVFVYSAFDQSDAPSSVFDISTQVITATAGQTTFTLTTFTYLPGTDTLQVYRNGLRLTSVTDYVETNSSTVTLTTPAALGDEFLFQGGAVITGNQTPGTAVSFIQAGTGAVTRNMQDKVRETVSVFDFGAVGDGVTDDYPAFAAALAATGSVYVPRTTVNVYNISQPIVLTSNQSLISDSSVRIAGTGTGGALIITGAEVNVDIGEIAAPNSQYVIKYYNLEYSIVRIRRCGQCTAAVIYHDGDLQTISSGNNRWYVGDIQAGSVPYGVRIKNSTTHILEGEIWDIECILSATVCAFRLGESSASILARWNTYRMAIDAQGITPLLIDVYQSQNNIELINWAGQVSPPVAHVLFNTGTGANFLSSKPGIQDPLIVVDNGGNRAMTCGQNDQIIYNGRFWINLPAGGGAIPLAVGQSLSSGGPVAVIENTSSANNTTKYCEFTLRGRDTANSGKNTATIRSTPQDADFVNATLGLYGRNSDQIAGYAFFGVNGTPEGQITAPIGAIATRRDGSTGTTFYVKESGTGNTGWVAK